jgi:AraC family transcriptional regulator, exoenzyme S synthesis regulatory protein ExsA
MQGKEENKLPQIMYSCYAHKSSEGEHFIPEHVFGFTISGNSEVHLGNKTYTFKEGDYRFFRKNQLSRYTKYPPAGGEYRSVSILLDQHTLRSMGEEYNLHVSKAYTGEGSLQLQPNKLFKNYIDSLTPYLDGINDISKALTTIKVKEIIMILLDTNPTLKDVLFDFSEPGKIDLEAYMNEHYKFNVDISRFAYLTGRSLATFKRDFEKIFNTSPNKWLQQKRLNDAYYLIKEKGWKSSDVYLEVGFKDFSHFSFAFKKAYGVAPSRVV